MCPSVRMRANAVKKRGSGCPQHSGHRPGGVGDGVLGRDVHARLDHCRPQVRGLLAVPTPTVRPQQQRTAHGVYPGQQETCTPASTQAHAHAHAHAHANAHAHAHWCTGTSTDAYTHTHSRTRTRTYASTHTTHTTHHALPHGDRTRQKQLPLTLHTIKHSCHGAACAPVLTHTQLYPDKY